MSNETELNAGAGDVQEPTRKQLLMQKARVMGIQFSNNISEDALAAKIKEKEEGVAPKAEAKVNPLIGEQGGDIPEEELTPAQLRKRIYDEQMALVRCRVTNMDPSKKDLQGEVLTVANELLGTVRKFIPFGEATENGYHIPRCLLTMMQERKFCSIRTVRDPRTGMTRPETSWVREFAIEILDPLTPEELKQLATAQIAAGTFSAGSDE